MILIVGLTKQEIDALIAVARKNWVEPELQPIIISAINKLTTAVEMKPASGAKTKLG